MAFKDTFTFSKYLKKLYADIEAAKGGSPEAEGVYNTRTAELLSRRQAADRAYSQWGVRSGNLGSAFTPGLTGAFSPLINKIQNPWGRTALGGLAPPLVESGGNLASALMRQNAWENAGEGAEALAGDLAEGRNGEARARIMDQAARDTRDMNLEAESAGGQITDSAINRANAYESGMAAVGRSGIEGGGNMERNLQYGRSRGEAQEQLMYDMMSNRAGDYSNAMAQSFSELSAVKGREMTGAWSGVLRGLSADMDADKAATDAYITEIQPGFGDYEQMLEDMRAANLKGSPGAASDPQSLMNNLPPELQSVYDNMTDEQKRLLQQQMGGVR
jgi:hypothetical protein